MDSHIQQNPSNLLNDSRSIISELKTTILNIHKAKLLKQTKDLASLIVRKDNLILLLRHKSRELSIVYSSLVHRKPKTCHQFFKRHCRSVLSEVPGPALRRGVPEV